MFALLVALHDVFMPLPDVAYGALYGIAFFALIQLAWRSTHVRNQRTLRPGMVVLVDQRSAAALSGRMRVCECESARGCVGVASSLCVRWARCDY